MTKARDLANLISGGFTEADIPNLSASKITSGTFADARLSQSSVQQYASTFDDNKIVNDISTLGLRVHTQENLNASNTNSASFDVFQDSSGITNLTSVVRNDGEFIQTGSETFVHQSSANGFTEANIRWIKSDTTDGSTSVVDSSSTSASLSRGSVAHSTTYNKIGTSSLYFNSYSSGISSSGTNTNINSQSNYTISFWVYFISSGTIMSYGSNGSAAVWQTGINNDGKPFLLTGTGWAWDNTHLANSVISTNTWTHIQWVKTGGNIYLYVNGVLDDTLNGTTSFNNGGSTNYTLYIGSYFNASVGFKGYLDEIRMMTSAELPTTSNFGGKSTTTTATGSFEGNAISVSSTNEMGAVLTYQDHAGVNTLNTDIILKLSADNGSNYSTATLTALPDFATGIKMAKVNDLSVTAGTQLKYKIEFANQASGSKEARIRGVSLQY